MPGFRGEPKYGPERVGDEKHSVANLGRTERSLGYKPKVTFEEGLRRTVDWYRSKQSSPRVDLPETYISGTSVGILEEVKARKFNLPAGR
jgi:dTDP-D-glucose 4,6-dehydratase